MQEIYLNNKSASIFELCLSERPVIPTVKRSVTSTEVKGSRHGSQIKKYGYEDMDIKVTFNYLDDDYLFKDAYPKIREWILDSTELKFSDEDGYRRIKNTVIEDATNEVEEYGEFEVTFTVDPLLYFDSDPITINTPSAIYNPGSSESEPYIKIETQQTNFTLSINNENFVFKNLTHGGIELDCEAMNAYTTNSNGDIVNENFNMYTPFFPLLERGKNSFSWTGEATITVDGRWVLI